MIKSNNDLLTLCLHGGGANSNACLLKKKYKNYDIESLRS